MDPQYFKQQLEQWAELKQIKPPKSAATRENEEPEVIERQGQTVTIDIENNPTINWCIKKMKPHVAVCEDCHMVATNRVLQIQRYNSPKGHWRKHCNACNLGQNPYNGKFELKNKLAHPYNAAFLDGKPEPERYAEKEQKAPVLKPVYKKPTK